MAPADGMKVLAIFAEGIKSGDSTFETNVPTWREWDRAHLPMHRLVAVEGENKVLGFAALSRVSERRAYSGVAESTVYVRADSHRRGVGTALLSELISVTETAGIWTLQAGIFPENTASIALHEKLGFRIVGRRERIGRHRGKWRDVLLMERRSPAIL
jgi:phosphinothricin acetyltransferase